MCSFHFLKIRYPYNASPPRIGSGAVSTDKMKRCYKCKEPIAFARQPNGKWQLLDFFTGQPHEHRYRNQQID